MSVSDYALRSIRAFSRIPCFLITPLNIGKLNREFIDELLRVDVLTCGSRINVTKEITKELVNGVRGLGYGLVVVDGRVEYRALPGMGAGAPVVNFMPLWHPVLDVPWFPGSSIKGVLRAAYREYLGELGVSGECVEFCEELVFGSTGYRGVRGHAGLIVVFDALPVECGFNGGLLEADVITPHYQGDRYIETELDVEPTPILGLAIARGTVFRFIVGFAENPRVRELVFEDRCVSQCFPYSTSGKLITAKLLYNVVRKALTEIGLGAKTTRGYGYFDKLVLKDYVNYNSRPTTRR